MKFDFTVTITAILGIAAVISPIATAIINNLYQLKVKKLELEQNHKDKTTYYVRSIFENYLRYTGKCIDRMISETEGNYGEYYFLALTYSPSHIADALISINASIHNGDLESAASQLEQLRPQIAELLQSL